jgi:hypothetical protein
VYNNLTKHKKHGNIIPSKGRPSKGRPSKGRPSKGVFLLFKLILKV